MTAFIKAAAVVEVTPAAAVARNAIAVESLDILRALVLRVVRLTAAVVAVVVVVPTVLSTTTAAAKRPGALITPR